MKILWITNTIFPAPSKELGLEKPVTGGWMFGSAEKVAQSPGIQLAIATTYEGNELRDFNIEGIKYYLLPSKPSSTYRKELEPIWEKLCLEFKPDIVHIHGTEYAHGLACMRKLPHLKYVISIQGLLTICSKYYYAGISFWDILKTITFRDLVKMDTLFQAKNQFKKRGLAENEYLQRTKHVVGRTQWDYSYAKAINNKLIYHFCNESLRDKFYTANKWSLDKCNPNSIFLSQATYPIKGLHQVIKALIIFKKDYPNVMIRVAGPDITKTVTFMDKIKFSGYGKYVRSLIKKDKLENHITFLGTLSEEQMIIEYQTAHVFICPSSIENSPNSLGEAQILGVPSIAAYVGGVPDMIENYKTGLLYRFEDIEILAENIRKVFTSNLLANQLSENGIQAASRRHNPIVNLQRTLEIYKDVKISKVCTN